MPPSIDFCHLCDYAFLDDRKKLCIVGIFDQWLASDLPATTGIIYLAGRITGRPNDRVSATVAITKDNGAAIVEAPVQLSCGPAGNAGFILQIPGLQLPEFGRYAVGIFLSADTPLAVLYLTVKTPPQEPPAQGIH